MQKSGLWLDFYAQVILTRGIFLNMEWLLEFEHKSNCSCSWETYILFTMHETNTYHVEADVCRYRVLFRCVKISPKDVHIDSKHTHTKIQC